MREVILQECSLEEYNQAIIDSWARLEEMVEEYYSDDEDVEEFREQVKECYESWDEIHHYVENELPEEMKKRCCD